jgi:hypothetical protein
MLGTYKTKCILEGTVEEQSNKLSRVKQTTDQEVRSEVFSLCGVIIVHTYVAL